MEGEQNAKRDATMKAGGFKAWRRGASGKHKMNIKRPYDLYTEEKLLRMAIVYVIACGEC